MKMIKKMLIMLLSLKKNYENKNNNFIPISGYETRHIRRKNREECNQVYLYLNLAHRFKINILNIAKKTNKRNKEINHSVNTIENTKIYLMVLLLKKIFTKTNKNNFEKLLNTTKYEKTELNSSILIESICENKDLDNLVKVNDNNIYLDKPKKIIQKWYQELEEIDFNEDDYITFKSELLKLKLNLKNII